MNSLKEYRPKTKSNWIITKQQVIDGHIPMLDLQLGGACNANCVYCDSPKYGEPNKIEIPHIERLIDEGKISWIFICGLGEPTAGDNREKFKTILNIAKTKGIRVSAFSNIIDLDRDLLDHIDRGTLNVLHKLDTFDEKKIKLLYGIDENKTRSHLENMDAIKQIAINNRGIDTQVAASIVLTNKNMDEAEKLIDYCLHNGIFPEIGELEEAGKSTGETFDTLNPSNREVRYIKSLLEERGIRDYKTPFCPATFGSIHIDNYNFATLNRITGLSCSWFTLADNNTCSKYVLGDIRDMSYKEICDKIYNFRIQKYSDITRILDNFEETPLIGGCGGDPKVIMETHKSSIEEYAINRNISLEQ